MLAMRQGNKHSGNSGTSRQPRPARQAPHPAASTARCSSYMGGYNMNGTPRRSFVGGLRLGAYKYMATMISGCTLTALHVSQSGTRH